MTMKETTFQVVGRNPDNTFTVREVAGETSMVPASGGGVPSIGSGGGGFQARVNGRIVTFASEADFREAEMAWREMQGGGGMSMPELGRSGMMMNRGGGGAGFLRTGSDAAEAITGFFQGRNLRQKRDDLIASLDAEAAARDRIAQLTSKYGDLLGPLLDWMDAERQVTAGALGILDDQIFAFDMQAGIGVVRTMSDLWDGMRTGGFGGQSEGAFSALAAGAIGLGVGYIISTSGRGRRGARRV